MSEAVSEPRVPTAPPFDPRWGAVVVIALLMSGAEYGRLAFHLLPPPTFHSDFEIYYAVSQRLHAAPETLWDPYQHGHLIGYPPSTFTVMWPLALFSETGAWRLWLVTNQILYLTSAWLTVLLFARGTRLRALPIVLFVFLSSWPAYECFRWGQLNMFLLLGIIAHLLLTQRGCDFWGGLALGICCGLKPYPGILGIPLVLNRRWIAILGVAAGGAAMGLLPCVMTGRNVWSQWLNGPWSLMFADYAIAIPYDQGLRSYFIRLFKPDNGAVVSPFDLPWLVQPLSYAVFLGSLVGFAGAAWRRSKGLLAGTGELRVRVWQAMLFLSLMLGISPSGQDHYFIWPLIPLCWLLMHPDVAKGSAWSWAAVTLVGATLLARLPYDHKMFLHGYWLFLGCPRLLAVWGLTFLVWAVGPYARS